LKSRAKLGLCIITKIIKYYQKNVLENSQYYESKYKIDRILFLKIYNLFTSMSFITVHSKCID
jgi:hypothetical protein